MAITAQMVKELREKTGVAETPTANKMVSAIKM